MLPPSSLILFGTDTAIDGFIEAIASLKLSLSISVNFLSERGGNSELFLPARSAITPTIKGNSIFWMASPISTSYVNCTRGGLTRFKAC